MKESIITELTRIDTANLRLKGLKETGRYTKEPPLFRVKLSEIYKKLDLEDLKELLKLKKL
jgi:hypothetical protein